MDNEIKKIRLEMNLSQDKFSSCLKVSQSTLSHYEKGVRLPDIKIAKKIVKFALSQGIQTSLDKIYDAA